MKTHSSRFLALVTEAKSGIKEVSPQELKEKLVSTEGMYLIDVREDNEWATGYIPSAIHLSKGVIERDIEMKIPDVNAQIVVYCSGGFRSALVANTLQKMGYIHVYSLNGGLKGWSDADYALQK